MVGQVELPTRANGVAGYTRTMRERLVGLSLRRPRTSIAVAFLIAIGGVLGSFTVDAQLTAATTVPGSPSAEADLLMQSAFGEGFAGTFTIIVPFGDADDAEIRELEAQVRDAVDAVPTARVEQMRAIAGTLYALIGTDLPILEASASTPSFRRALADVGLAQAMLTGPPALEHDVRPVLAEDLRTGTLVGGLLILLVLLIAFGWSRIVLLPLFMALAVIGGSLAVVSMLSFVIPVVPYVTNIVELVGLGIAIDYALLLAHRLRQEVGKQPDPFVAVRAVFATAGRTVWLAGVTAAVSLLTLLLVPVPFVRSLAVAGVVVPVLAVITSHTVLPACMALIGTTVGTGGLLRVRETTERRQSFLRRRPGLTLVLGGLVLLLLASPVTTIRIAPASLTAIPAEVPAMQAVQYLQNRIGPGAITPHELLIDVGTTGARSPQNDKARQALADWLGDQPAVFGVFTESTTRYVDEAERFQRIFVLGRYGFADEHNVELVRSLRLLDLAQFGYGNAALHVGGSPAQGVDFLDALRTWVPWILMILLGAAWLALSRILRSWWLATCSVGLNLLTLTAVLGALVFLFQRSADAQLPLLLPVPQLESWALLLLTVLLFAITLDYQLFLLARVRERYVQSQDIDEAVDGGVADTAGVIVIAAIAFIGALSGLVLGRVAGLQELGAGLAIGVALDASIVRLFLLPALARLLRQKIWTQHAASH